MITEKKKLPPMLARLKKKGKIKIKTEDIEKYATEEEKKQLKEGFEEEHGIPIGDPQDPTDDEPRQLEDEQEAGKGVLSIVTIKLMIGKEDVDDLLEMLSDNFADIINETYPSMAVFSVDEREASPEELEEYEPIRDQV